MAGPGVPPLLSAEDLLQPGNPYDQGELWDGRWVVREPSGGPAEVVGVAIVALLAPHVSMRDLGWVTGSSQGFLVARGPDRVLSADAAFTSYARLPAVPRRGFFPCAPDFAVEVRSPYDSREGSVGKAGVWIGHGVAVVWLVDPEARTITVFRPGAEPEVVRPGAAAAASPVLPDFQVDVAAAFARVC